tara:strand:+ start:154 stop:591 length:438 start_codon:yes stop_codon:yes gene_type:complete
MPTKITRNKYIFLVILFIISLISSLIISLQPVSDYCDVGEGCDVVQHSIYAKTFGIKSSHFGVLAFSLLLIVTLLQLKKPTKKKKQFIQIGIIISAIIAIKFIYIQAFVLNAYCTYCLIVDIAMILALILLMLTYKPKREVEKKP